MKRITSVGDKIIASVYVRYRPASVFGESLPNCDWLTQYAEYDYIRQPRELPYEQANTLQHRDWSGFSWDFDKLDPLNSALRFALFVCKSMAEKLPPNCSATVQNAVLGNAIVAEETFGPIEN